MKLNEDFGLVEIIDELPEKNWAFDYINLKKAHTYSKGEGVKIAVVDTGVFPHKDFEDRIKLGINMHTKTEEISDDAGHGTHVAGIIAGRHTGIAPEAELYVAKVLDARGLGSMGHVMDGITFAVNFGVDVLCLSLGVERDLPLLLREKIIEAHESGIIVVSATGNSGIKPPEYPAFYDYVLGVGGFDKDGNLAPFSNFGNEMDVLAPSVEIPSTFIDGKYALMSGTSMASPIVAGAVALMISNYRKQGKKVTLEDIRLKLSRLSERKTREFGYGLLDLSVLFED
jgi:subtilisin